MGASEWFLDERGRSLRATWHPEAGRLVLSLWSGTECVGTVRLARADAVRLMPILAAAAGGAGPLPPRTPRPPTGRSLAG